MTLITPRKSYQPFEYPEAHEYFVKQQQSHWLWSQCVMTSSVHDWETKLTEEEKKIISGTLLGFTQMELYIGNYWAQKVAQWFPKPEISLMAFTFAGMEMIHGKSYNYLNETLNLEEYDAFLREPSAAAKIENLINTKGDSLEDRAISLAVYSAFAEGVSLYANFAVLLYFSARGLIKELDRAGGKDLGDKYGLKGNYLELPSENMLKGVSEVIAYSVRDECHSPDTEVLTDMGWVRFDSLPQHCLLAQYDIETQEISFVRPLQYVKKKYSGLMVELDGKRKAAIKCRVTKDHDMVIHNTNRKKTYKLKANELNMQNKYEIPVAGYKLRGLNISLTALETVYVLSELIGNYIDVPDEDGLYTIMVNLSIKKEEDKINRMYRLIKRLEKEGVKTKTRKTKSVINFQFKLSKEQLKPRAYKWVSLTHCSQSWIEEFLMEVRFWRRGKPANRTCEVFYSQDKEATDLVQILCLMSGRSTEYYTDPVRGYKHGLKIWDDEAWKSTRSGTKSTKTYSGYVYCATVDKGTLITRYENSVMISGNCMHSNAGCWLFRQLRSEFPSLNNKRLNDTLYEAARTVVELEYNFIDMVFDNHELPGLNAHIVKSFIEQRTNQKLEELGLEPIFDVDKEAARQIERWFYLMTGGEASTDFFAAHVSNYAKGLFNTEAIDWDAVFA